MHYNFVEIGTADFDTCAHSCSENAVGLSIEPVPLYFNRLPSRQNISKSMCAISDTRGVGKMYYVYDIDINMYGLKMLKLNLDKMYKGKVDFFYLTRNCYELQDRFQILTKQFNIKFPILSGTIISKIKFPLIMLDKFFHCILNIEDKDCEYYKICYDQKSEACSGAIIHCSIHSELYVFNNISPKAILASNILDFVTSRV